MTAVNRPKDGRYDDRREIESQAEFQQMKLPFRQWLRAHAKYLLVLKDVFERISDERFSELHSIHVSLETFSRVIYDTIPIPFISDGLSDSSEGRSGDRSTGEDGIPSGAFRWDG